VAYKPGTCGRSDALISVGEDLRVPRFSITWLQAMSRRVRRNYCARSTERYPGQYRQETRAYALRSIS
jgi:hypothetical protein